MIEGLPLTVFSKFDFAEISLEDRRDVFEQA